MRMLHEGLLLQPPLTPQRHAHAQGGGSKEAAAAPMAAATGSKGFLRRRGHPVIVRPEPQPRNTVEHIQDTLQSPTARFVGGSWQTSLFTSVC